jgi:hypothetical protein
MFFAVPSSQNLPVKSSLSYVSCHALSHSHLSLTSLSFSSLASGNWHVIFHTISVSVQLSPSCNWTNSPLHRVLIIFYRNTGIYYWIQQFDPAVWLGRHVPGISCDPKESSPKVKDLVITNAIKCSISFSSQTAADQTKVH